jgi:type I restriction enzyme R subunit
MRMLSELLAAVETDQQRKKAQAAKGLDALTYFVLCKLMEDGVPHADSVSKKVGAAFTEFPNWRRAETEYRELRKKVTFAIFVEEDDMGKVTHTVEALFTLVEKSFRY